MLSSLHPFSVIVLFRSLFSLHSTTDAQRKSERKRRACGMFVFSWMHTIVMYIYILDAHTCNQARLTSLLTPSVHSTFAAAAAAATFIQLLFCTTKRILLCYIDRTYSTIFALFFLKHVLHCHVQCMIASSVVIVHGARPSITQLHSLRTVAISATIFYFTEPLIIT